MKIDILTLFPEMFVGPFSESIIKRAQEKQILSLALHNLRDWAGDKHGTVDDTPYGGGPGMVMKVDVVDRALHDLKLQVTTSKSQVSTKQKVSPYVILLTPQGKPFTQKLAQKLATKPHLILVAGHYEGFDERIRRLVDEEISIGDYVLTGGELPAMVVTDAVVRLLPGVLGDPDSSREESFSPGPSYQPLTPLLEYPHYTRPEAYEPTSITRKRPLVVPPILLSGHHAKIAVWRNKQALERTKKRRSDLIERT